MRKVLFIGQYAGRTGAPILLLNLLKWLAANTDIPFELLLEQGGELLPEYEQFVPVVDVRSLGQELERAVSPRLLTAIKRRVGLSTSFDDRLSQRLQALYRDNDIGLVYCNTVACGKTLARLSHLHCPVLAHVHELDYWIRYRAWESFSLIKDRAHHYIAASKAVRDNLVSHHGIPGERVSTVNEFVPLNENISENVCSCRRRIRRQLGIPEDALVVGGSGTLDWRKGSDLFIQLASITHRRSPEIMPYFVWLGGETAGPAFGEFWYDVGKVGLNEFVRLTGMKDNPADFMAAFDVFALTSREDPFPLVMLEAGLAGKPIVCFDGSGGAGEFVEHDAGFLVPYLNLETFVDRILDLLQSETLRQRLGMRAMLKVQQRHSMSVAAPMILELIRQLSAH